LWQVAASKKLLDRLSGFLDDIHECSPVQQVQELRQKNGNARCPRNEATAKLLWRVDTRKGREMSLLGTWQTFGTHPQMSAFGGKADMGITLRDQSRHAACASGRSAFGAEADMISDRSSRKRFSYFRFGRLRFGDDVASRRFAHLVSDGLPFT
ncbi:MAG: hypothetical protein WCD87_22010, partial [Pseudolabrys sp.]